MKPFNDDEVRFMLNGSRQDFLIYYSIDNQPIAVIEVEGASYHPEEGIQAKHDSLKDSFFNYLGRYIFHSFRARKIAKINIVQ